MAIDINYLRNVYFAFDEPVPYKLKCGATLNIKPVKLLDSMLFMSSYGILDIDKNNSNDVEIIQMSYLKYLATQVLTDKIAQQQMINICLLCLGFEIPFIRFDEKGKAILSNVSSNSKGEIKELFYITAKEFDDIKRIILYQNLPNYDDEYIDPELKKNMEEMDMLKTKGMTIPKLERKMAIITAHTGIPKEVQKQMTYREHTILFEEVCGEVDYTALKGISCYAGKSDNIQWIYRKSKDKYDDYITSVEKYNNSMGGNGTIKNISTQSGEALASQYDNFIGG